MAITWRFRLTSGTAQIDFFSDKVTNWDAIKLSFQRNETLRGVLFQYSNVFEFIGDVRLFVRDVVDSGGIEAELFLQMWVGNESGHRGSFKQLGTPLKATLGKTYSINETSVNVTFSISGFEEMLLNRLDTEIEYDIEESVDGVNIGAPKYKNITLHDRVINGTANMKVDQNIAKSPYGRMNMLATEISNNTQIVTPVYYQEAVTTPFQTMIKSIEDNTKISIDITNMVINFTATYGTLATGFEFKLLKIAPNGAAYPDPLYLRYTNIEYNPITMYITVLLNYVLQNGEGIAFVLQNLGAQEPNIIYKADKLVVAIESPSSPSKAKCILPHEAFERQIAKITGKSNSFLSTFLGRTSLGYNINGEGAFFSLLNGKLIRGFSTEDSKITFKMKDLLKTFINGWNLVANIKDEKLILERIEDVYNLNDSIKIDIVGSVKASLIENDHLSNIKYGVKDFQIEEVTGLDDFAGTYERQTPIKSTDVKLDLTIPYLTGGYIIEFTRRREYVTNPTLDYRSDKENFIIASIQNGNTDDFLLSKKGTTEPISGILSPATAYNVDLRPSKLLSNWYNVISSGLYQLSTKSIKFVKGANNTNLVVNGVGETDDILISSLGTPLFLPYLLEFEGKLSTDQFNELILNPNRTIEIGETRLFGVIDELEYDINTQKADFKLIRANR